MSPPHSHAHPDKPRSSHARTCAFTHTTPAHLCMNTHADSTHTSLARWRSCLASATSSACSQRSASCARCATTRSPVLSLGACRRDLEGEKRGACGVMHYAKPVFKPESRPALAAMTAAACQSLQRCC